MITIFFLEYSKNFNGNDLNSEKIAGSEKTLINISNEIAKNKNIKVKVFNNAKDQININDVEWCNIKNILNFKKPDFLISMSDINLFPNYKCKKYLWSHSVQTIEKFIRKGQLIPFLKHKPKIILEGDYHYKNRSWMTSCFGKDILKISADDDFINTTIDVHNIPKNNVIFNTRPDRNLKVVLEAWKTIKKKVNNAILYINPPYELTKEEINLDIRIRHKGSKFDLIEDLKNSKLMLNPGHKGEVFCLVAEEARTMCLPIVTMGIGSLNERVIDNVTGYICSDLDQLISKSVSILKDDKLYLTLKSNLYEKRKTRTYKEVVNDFLKILNINEKN
ncbi:MAG: glycosyltransferase [Candidatus Pelagibacter sp.]